jgi:hypothetical protein
MKQKLIFFDIDGTLAMPGNLPSAVTVQAIRAVRKAGHKVFLSTGRTQRDVSQSILNIGFDGGIYSAGGLVCIGDHIISQHTMAADTIRKLIPLLNKQKLFFTLEGQDINFKGRTQNSPLHQIDFSLAGSELGRFLESTLLNEDGKSAADYRDEPIYKITFLADSDRQISHLMNAVVAFVKVVLFDNLISDLPILAGEISDFSVSKGTALHEICTHYHTSAADCIAFGDSMNDAEILTTAGLGIAMGNAPQRVKQLADRICGSCEADGVAHELYSLFF